MLYSTSWLRVSMTGHIPSVALTSDPLNSPDLHFGEGGVAVRHPVVPTNSLGRSLLVVLPIEIDLCAPVVPPGRLTVHGTAQPVCAVVVAVVGREGAVVAVVHSKPSGVPDSP